MNNNVWLLTQKRPLLIGLALILLCVIIGKIAPFILGLAFAFVLLEFFPKEFERASNWIRPKLKKIFLDFARFSDRLFSSKKK